MTVSSLSCSTAGGTRLASLGAGNYALDGSSCSGSAGGDYSLGFSGVTDGFVVNPEPVTVNVSGSQTYGGSPSFTYTTSPPGGDRFLAQLLDGGGHDLDQLLARPRELHHRGLELFGQYAGADYSLTFSGVSNGLGVTKATPVITWASPGTILYGTSLWVPLSSTPSRRQTATRSWAATATRLRLERCSLPATARP